MTELTGFSRTQVMTDRTTIVIPKDSISHLYDDDYILSKDYNWGEILWDKLVWYEIGKRVAVLVTEIDPNLYSEISEDHRSLILQLLYKFELKEKTNRLWSKTQIKQLQLKHEQEEKQWEDRIDQLMLEGKTHKQAIAQWLTEEWVKEKSEKEKENE